MATLYTLTVSAPDVEQPVTSGKPRESALNIAKFFEKLASGSQLGTTTVTVGNTGVRSSATATCAAVQAADTVTINGTALTATKHNATNTITPTVSGIDVDDTVTIKGIVLTAKRHYATGTATCSSVDAADTITIGATTFVGTAGAVTPGAATFSVDTGNNETATSLAAQINAHAVASTVVTASASSAVVTLRAVTAGTAGNSIVLTSSDGTDLAVSGTGTLANATAPATDEFDISGTNAQCVTSIAAAIAANPTLAALFTTTTSSTVCTIRAIEAGTAANAYPLVSSDAQLAVGAATFAGGAAVANNQFDYVGSNTETATALAAAINASTTAAVQGLVAATSSDAVVTVAAKAVGPVGNFITFVSSNGTRLAVTGSGVLASGSQTLITLSY